MKLLIKPQNKLIEADSGSTIMEALIAADIKLDAPCGGRGVCGKCKVKIIDDLQETTVLACKTVISSDLTIDISGQDEGHRIMMGGISHEVTLSPAVYAIPIKVPKPSTGDLRSCWERLKQSAAEKAGIDKDEIPPNPHVAKELYKTLENNKYELDAILCRNEIIGISAQNEPVCAMAYDIGTTTVAAYLLDLRSGRRIAQASTLNPQVKYGADVIMRSKYAIENSMEGLSGDIRDALSALCVECANSAGVKPESVFLVTVVGNTCMHHLFLGISPASLAYAPYTAALTEPVIIGAAQYISSVNECAKLFMLPNIAGFVGADTVGAALAAQMDTAEELTLLIDIGTNGEMVLGDKNRLITCSTAAGPAFEGAVISCGMRGARGAIDHISFSGGKLDYSVIGDCKPTGICGSGLIDLVSELVRTGLAEPGGKLLSGGEITDPEGLLYADRIEIEGNIRSFVLAYETQTENGEKLVLTQKDIREVQLAKGAMAAGISMMAKKLAVNTYDIKNIMIAGAFGSYMNPKSACGISLIPPKLADRVKAIGNAAGQGAVLSALSYEEFKRAEKLAVSMEYLELAADPEFQDEFVDNLEF